MLGRARPEAPPQTLLLKQPDPEGVPGSSLDRKLKLGPLRARAQEAPPCFTEEGRASSISGLWPGPAAPCSAWTYPVLARVALTLTHTATNTAGRPVDAEGAACEGPQALPMVSLPSAHLASPFLSSSMTPQLIPSLSLSPVPLGPWAAW